ncbi:hypothetical protein FQ707_12660 [Bacteroidaceae bacterium HV4-6-C5C]|nr:hypothetical protein FQ707_12660 [Bacteroidaceae bacterium HV4-6-C5C]
MSRITLYCFKKWENAELSEKIETLFIKDGRGAKPKLDSIIEELPDLVERYNGKFPLSFGCLKRIMG